MSLIITEADKRLLLMRSKKVYGKIELINKNHQVIEELQGEVLSANISIDADSDIRRTLDLSLQVKDRSFFVAAEPQIWIDKHIKCYCGISNQQTSEVIWYLLGTFVFAENNYQFDVSTHTLSLSCVDLMAMLTDARGSQIGASKTVIEVDTSIRNALISVLTSFSPIQKYSICEFPYSASTVPYDLEYEAGAYPYEIITDLRDIYPCYETFADLEGMFICQKIPSCVEDAVFLNGEIIDPLIISESRSISLSEVKNVTEIWGQSLESDYFANKCQLSTKTYQLTFDIANNALVNGKMYGFTADKNNPANCMIKVDALTAYPAYYIQYKSDGTEIELPLPANEIVKGIPYVFKYHNSKFYLQGELQIHAIVKEVEKLPSVTEQEQDIINNDCRNIEYQVNPLSPFCIEKIGEVRRVCSGGDYDNIYTTRDALDRAKFENWTTTRFVESVTLKCVAIPWLDVNKKIEYTSPNTKKRNQYLVKSINLNLEDFTMDIRLIRFYPYLPF